MKYKLTFKTESPFSIPIQYNKILQAAILSWLNDWEYSAKVHDEGFENENRVFKLYTFSSIIGRHSVNKENHTMTFFSEIELYLSFYSEETHSYIMNSFGNRIPLRLGNNLLYPSKLSYVDEEYTDCIVEAVSPITVHSTFETSDGRKKTYYYSPNESDFSDMIKKNLIHKLEAVGEYFEEEPVFSIQPITESKQISIYYDSFLIKGYKGKFRISGSPKMIEMALLAGVGDRNSVGLGCIKIIDK